MRGAPQAPTRGGHRHAPQIASHPDSLGPRIVETLLIVIIMGAAVADLAHAAGERTPSPDAGKTTISSPADGAVVSNPVTIQFGLEGATSVE